MTRPNDRSHRLLITLAASTIATATALAAAPNTSALPAIPPSASLTASPNPALINETVTFDGSGSSGDGLGSTVSTYEWDLDDDNVFETNTGSTPTTSRPYSNPATMTIRLRVTDNEGDTDEDSVVLTVNTPPVAGFIFEPSTPAVNEQITFSSTSSDPDGQIAPGALRWDFDADGQFDDAVGETVSRSFDSAGTKPVRLEVTDPDGATAVSARDVLVQANPPVATFTFSPGTPRSNQTVDFDGSASAPPSGATITAMTWDLDGDGDFDDAGGPTARFSYPTPGPRTVRLRVDSSAGFDITSRVVLVGNRAPLASFDVTPRSPRARQTVKLSSTSSDSDGPIAEQSWDLDGDGDYDDADGSTASAVFRKAGKFIVGLKLRDANGATDEVRAPITVRPRLLAPLSPFPVVRLAGELAPGGDTVITRLSVRASKGTDVTVRCLGGSCPFGEKQRTVRHHRVNFPELERELEPGVVIKVFAAKSGAIGSFTRFNLRRGRPPERIESCVRGGRRDPIPCPRS